MRSRGLVVAIAVVLAVAAAAAVVLYVQGVKQDAVEGGNLQTVIVATQDIPSNQRLDPLIDQGLFDEVRVPGDALIADPVTDVTELEGKTTVTPIIAKEQISQSRLSGADRPLNLVGVSKGHVGVAFEFEAPRGGAGNIQPGDHVAVFATYQNTEILTGPTLQQALNNNIPDTLQQKKVEAPDFTVTLIPTVRVLKIENPSVDAETGEQSDSDRIRVTLDLLPEDAQAIVYAQEIGLVWLGLLAPEDAETGVGQPPAAQVPVELILGRRAG
jgi:Flp pilus assembly protein CpaB